MTVTVKNGVSKTIPLKKEDGKPLQSGDLQQGDYFEIDLKTGTIRILHEQVQGDLI